MPTDGDTWAIDARGLTKTFGAVTAVRGVTLQVPSGTIFAFLGPNGSGKSTTTRSLRSCFPFSCGVRSCVGNDVKPQWAAGASGHSD